MDLAYICLLSKSSRGRIQECQNIPYFVLVTSTMLLLCVVVDDVVNESIGLLRDRLKGAPGSNR